MIYVFRTSVRTKKAIQELSPYLNKILSGVTWNFDIEDCDRILRLDTPIECSASVIQLLHDRGFECEELED